jgi:hypothetical protein
MAFTLVVDNFGIKTWGCQTFDQCSSQCWL